MHQPGYVLGIDPGFTGGLAFLPRADDAVYVHAMPVIKAKGHQELDVTRLLTYIGVIHRRVPVVMVVVERVASMPKQGVTSTFTFGRSFGEILGVIKTLRLPLELVRPQAWKKVVLAGTKHDKSAAIAYCQQRFPEVDLLSTPLSRVPHDGIADALCLAEWGRRLLQQNSPSAD